MPSCLSFTLRLTSSLPCLSLASYPTWLAALVLCEIAASSSFSFRRPKEPRATDEIFLQKSYILRKNEMKHFLRGSSLVEVGSVVVYPICLVRVMIASARRAKIHSNTHVPCTVFREARLRFVRSSTFFTPTSREELY